MSRKAPAASSAPSRAPKDLWADLQANAATAAASASSREASVIFLGPRGSGKTTLMQGFMFKDRDEVPKPTSSLDYRCTRTGVKDSLNDEKSVTHFWELGGGRSFLNLLEIAITPTSIADSLLVLVLDLSSPGRLLDDFAFFLKSIRKRIDSVINQIKKNTPNSPIPAQLLARAQKSFGVDGHPDGGRIGSDLSLVPILVCLNKYDITAPFPPESLKQLIRAARSMAHQHGCHLMYTSRVQRESYLKAFKSRLNAHLLAAEPPKKAAAVVDPTGTLNIPPGTDQFSQIGEPPERSTSWSALIAKLFPLTEADRAEINGPGGAGDDANSKAIEEIELIATAPIRIPAFTSDLSFDRHAALSKSSAEELKSAKLSGVSSAAFEARDLAHALLACAKVQLSPDQLSGIISGSGSIPLSLSNPTDAEISIARGSTVGRFQVDLHRDPELPPEPYIDDLLKAKEEDFKKMAREAATRRRMNAVEIRVK